MPQFISVWHVVKAISRATEEGPKHGLDDIFRIKTRRQLIRRFGAGQRSQARSVLKEELRGRVLFPITKALQQDMIRRVRKHVSRRVISHRVQQKKRILGVSSAILIQRLITA